MSGRGWRAVRLAGLAVCILAAGVLRTIPAAQGDTVELAVAGPMSGADAASGRAMHDAVLLYAEQVNAAGGLEGREVVVRAYDNQRSADLARKNAREIAVDSDAVAVLGHYYSSNSIAAGGIYAEHGLPAITGSATAPGVTGGNPWYFRTIADNDMKGRLAAQYLRSFLNRETVYIAYETDAYGTTLQQALARTAPEVGISVGGTWGVDSQGGEVGARLDAIAAELADAGPDAAVFLGLLNRESAMLVKRLRDIGAEVAILGGDSVGLGTFPQAMAQLDLGNAGVADYIDGIHATTYFIPDVGNRAAREFVRAFQERFGRTPDALAATYYDAAAVALAAYREAAVEGDLAARRAALREALQEIDRPARAVAGITGRIHFDAEGNAVMSAPFGVYERGRLISAPGQLTPVANPEATVDLDARLAAGDIVEVAGQHLYKTAVVYTGLDLNAVEGIDQRNGTFDADFYLWFRHNVPLDHSRIVFTNAAEPIRLGEAPLVSVETDAGRYTAYRVTGRFRHDFDFRDYPFDSQSLEVRLRHRELTLERLVFVADDAGMRGGGGGPAAGNRAAGQLADSEWTLGGVLAFSDVQETESTLGNPLLIAGAGEETLSYSRFNVTAEIARDPASYVLKNMVPLVIFVILGYCMMFIHPDGPPFVARLSLGVTALLTTVFYSQRAANELPDIGYLVAMDYIYYAVYAYFLVGIALTVAEHVALVRKNPGQYERLDRFGRLFMPVLMAAMAGGALLLYP